MGDFQITAESGGPADIGTLQITFAGSQGQQGIEFIASLVAIGGEQPYTFSINSGSLPTGLTLDTTTGTISGTPTDPGVFSFVGRVTDDASTTADVNAIINITDPSGASIAATLSPITATDNTGARWQDGGGAVHAVVSVDVAISAYPRVVTIQTDSPQYGRINHGLFVITAPTTVDIGAQGSNTSIFPPTDTTSENVVVTVALGIYDWSTDLTTLSGIEQDTVSVSGPPAPGATEATGFYITASAPTYHAGPGGASLFSFRIQGKLPITAADGTNFYAARLLLRTKNSGGTYGGQRPNTMDPDDPRTIVGDYAGPTATYLAEDHADNVTGDPSTGAIVWDILNWSVPNDGYDRFEFEIWVSSRRSGGTWTKQNAWSAAAGTSTPGTNSSQTLTVDGTKSKVLGPQVSGSVPSADSAPWSGLTGPIKTGGGGTWTLIQEITNAAGTVVAAFGKMTVSGTDYYGIWGANVWIGGTGPSNPKAWIDGSGNLQMVGFLNNGSGITIQTGLGEVQIGAGSNGVYVENALAGSFAYLSSGGLFTGDGSGGSNFSPGTFSFCRGKFTGDANGLPTKANDLTLEGMGFPLICDLKSGSVSTNGTHNVSLEVNGTTPPSGLYRVSFKGVVTNFGSGGQIQPVVACADGGASGGGARFPTMGGVADLVTFGAGNQNSFGPCTIYSNGSGITLQMTATGLAGGAAMNYYATLERLS